MSTRFDRDVQRACEPFERDHDRLREELMASLPVETPQGPGIEGHGRRRLRIQSSTMRRRILSIGIPSAVAAAVLLAVGLWSGIGQKGTGGSGRVYALSDVPSLLDSAHTLHLRWLYYHPAWAPPEQEREIRVHDYWVDQVNLSWCRRDTTMGNRPEQQAGDQKEPYASVEFICDGEYVMVVDHAKKSVTYEKPTPFKLRYKVRHERQGATPITAELLEGCTYVGQELLDGQPHQVWEHVVPPYGDGRSFKSRLWFSPQQGEVSLIRDWAKSPRTNEQWVEAQAFDLFERDVEPPPGTFSTEPPVGYQLTNTKETAEPDTLDTCSVLGRVGQRTVYGHVSYELPGCVLLFGSSCVEKGKESNSQGDLFEDLLPGCPLPKLPLEIHTFWPDPRMGTLAWSGRHLAYTCRNGRYYAWSLYVPNQAAPLAGIGSYEGEYRLHTEGPDTLGRDRLPQWGAGAPLRIRSAADFDEFVLGAMAELSDNGVAPEYVTYEYVMQLCEKIRSSLEELGLPLAIQPKPQHIEAMVYVPVVQEKPAPRERKSRCPSSIPSWTTARLATLTAQERPSSSLSSNPFGRPGISATAVPASE